MSLLPNKICKIILISDSALIRDTFGALLHTHHFFHLLSNVTLEESTSAIHTLRPDIALLYIDTIDPLQLTIIQRLRKSYNKIKIIVYLEPNIDVFIAHVIKAGANSIINYNSDFKELIRACSLIQKGEHYLAQNIAISLAESSLISTHVAKINCIPIREFQVFLLLVRGLKSLEIAKQLSISEKTVNNHCHHLFKTLNLANRVQLTNVAHQLGLLDHQFLPA